MSDLSDKGWLAATILGPAPNPRADAFNHVLDLLTEYTQTVKEWGNHPSTSSDATMAWQDGKEVLMRWVTNMERHIPETFDLSRTSQLANEIDHITNKYRRHIPDDIYSELRRYAEAFRGVAFDVSAPKPEGS